MAWIPMCYRQMEIQQDQSQRAKENQAFEDKLQEQNREYQVQQGDYKKVGAILTIMMECMNKQIPIIPKRRTITIMQINIRLIGQTQLMSSCGFGGISFVFA